MSQVFLVHFIEVLRKRYQRELFYPGLLSLFVNPFYFARAELVNAVRKYAPQLQGTLLDIGCGTRPYEKLFIVDEYIGLDIDNESAHMRGGADYYYDGSKFPFPDASFDSALCNQVLEHVFNPDEFLSEIHRVLRQNSRLLLTVPFVWDEHEQPNDFARYSSFGLKALLERNGFELLEQEKLGADATILFQLTNAYLYKQIKGWPRVLNIAFTLSFMAMVNILGLVIGKIMPGNPDLFLDQIIIARKV